ncbi:hypothetical protein BD770DRAFT_400533, partial [Pilaira anomala]
MTVKSSITGIGWKPRYLSILKKLVHDVHIIVTHTYSFTRYIFIQELNLNLEEYAVQGFYKEVFLSLLDKIINKYKASYCRDSSFTPIKLLSAQKITSYEATKIQTACTNAINKDFGNKLRVIVNKLIGLKQRISQLTSEETKAKIKNISRIPKEFQDQKAIINFLNLSSKPFKDQGLNSSMKFRGTIMTDDIGISVIKQNFDT